MSSAFIIVDLQNDYYPDGKFSLVDIEETTKQTAKFLDFARSKGLKVVHVRHEMPEGGAFFVVNTPGAEINDAVKPANDETVITKVHPNSFHETNLQEVLQSNGIKKLYVAGAMANICIQGTVRHASELGYEVIVLKDAIGSRDFEFDGVVVKARDVKASVFATLDFGYAKLVNTDDAIKNFA